MALFGARLGSRFAPCLSSGGFVHKRNTTLSSFSIPKAINEETKHYAVGSKERYELREAVEKLRAEVTEVPCIIGGKHIRTGDLGHQVMPTNHHQQIATYHAGNDEVLKMAVENSLEAKKEWENLPQHERWAVYLKAADLLSTKYRAELCAAVMLGQGKNVWQAEIDAAMETCDFFRFNAKYAEDIYSMQPPENSFGIWNRTEYRPLEGFVLAISPFNFIAIAANLHAAPCIMGNVCIWKPSSTSILACNVIYRLLEEAGLPPGVVNMIPGNGPVVAPLLEHPDLGGLHFTGSTKVFNHLQKEVANNLGTKLKGYPRIVGETGGKNFHFVHESADVDTVVFNTVRGSFEYQGQKCSATSRMYCPKNRWDAVKYGMIEAVKGMKMGCVTEFDTFVAAVIDEASFDRITPFIDRAHESSEAEVIVGGKYDKSNGYFIEPTIILTTNPKYETMSTELFGPVLTVYVYDENHIEDALRNCDETSIYGLTGSIFAQDRRVVSYLTNRLRNAAGNFYVNDKSTGAVVGQQPFGGGRQSGTNDKSGSAFNLLRWTSVRSIKENHLPLSSFHYPHMESAE